jgi:hypothetical protein
MTKAATLAAAGSSAQLSPVLFRGATKMLPLSRRWRTSTCGTSCLVVSAQLVIDVLERTLYAQVCPRKCNIDPKGLETSPEKTSLHQLQVIMQGQHQSQVMLVWS